MSISALRLRSAMAFSASERGSLFELAMWGRLLGINDLRINAAGQPGSSRGRAGLAGSTATTRPRQKTRIWRAFAPALMCPRMSDLRWHLCLIHSLNGSCCQLAGHGVLRVLALLARKATVEIG